MYPTFKRLFDICLSGAGLVLLSPFLGLVAVLVKLTSRGPAFYRQTRIGRDGEPFEMWKFRTMVVGADTMGAFCYASVLHEGGKYRMWYYGAYRETSAQRLQSPVLSRGIFHEGPICYAESADGLHWTKPRLGQVDFNGSRDNNIIALPAKNTRKA